LSRLRANAPPHASRKRWPPPSTWTACSLKRIRMRFVIVLILSATSCSALNAKPRDWLDGVLTQITDNAPGVTPPGAETAYRLNITRAYYWVHAGKLTYVFVNSWNVGFHAPKAPLNLTVNGHVKITVEGKNVYIIDDAGKEVKRPLVAKIADTEPSETQ
jgi:hypothetical protein